MPFSLYQDVILTCGLPREGLLAGDVGTVVEHHPSSEREDGYSVEFFDMTGRSVAVVTVSASTLRPPAPADRPTVRALTR